MVVVQAQSVGLRTQEPLHPVVHRGDDDTAVNGLAELGDVRVAVTGLLQCRYPVQAAVQGAAEWMVHFTESR